MDETQLSLKRIYSCSHPVALFPGKKAEIEMNKNCYHLLNLAQQQARRGISGARPWRGGELLVALGHFIMIQIYPDGMYLQGSVGSSLGAQGMVINKHTFFIIEKREVVMGGAKAVEK